MNQSTSPSPKKRRGAPKANKNACKITDKDLRQDAYKQLCKWIGEGKSYKSYVYYAGEVSVTGETIEEWARNNPIEFDPRKREIAHAMAYQWWENVLKESALGMNPHGNTATLQMIMRNKFGWDKRDGSSQSEIDKERFKYLADWMDKAFKEAREKGS